MDGDEPEGTGTLRPSSSVANGGGSLFGAVDDGTVPG